MAKIYQGKNPNSYYNPYDFLQLGRRSPHRRFNHDFFQSALVGFNLYGMNGVMMAWFHTYLDYMSDIMRKNYGTKNRNAIEFWYNYYYNNDEQRKRRPKMQNTLYTFDRY